MKALVEGKLDSLVGEGTVKTVTFSEEQCPLFQSSQGFSLWRFQAK